MERYYLHRSNSRVIFLKIIQRMLITGKRYIDNEEEKSDPAILESKESNTDESVNINESQNTNEQLLGSVSKNVQRIKDLIEELKNNGADIELEEFDFETMYQLIVKLNK